MLYSANIFTHVHRHFATYVCVLIAVVVLYKLDTLYAYTALYACTQGVSALVLTDQGAYKGVSVMVELSSLE
jgi:hypothetical protein